MSSHNFHIQISKQPHWIVSYWETGRLLHLSVLLFILESYLYGFFLNWAIDSKYTFWTIFWACFFMFSFAHIFLVLADGWSRFQDYKRAKDQLFAYGCQPKIFNQFATSQCQRAACITAAKELGFEQDAREHYYNMGYRWHHLMPDFMAKDPFFFYKRYFWRRTFLEKYYKPKYNFRKLSMSLSPQ